MRYIEIIKDLMKKNNLSQQNLAMKIGVNQTTISQWLLGKKRPSYDNILTFYKIFNVTPNEFFGLEEYF